MAVLISRAVLALGLSASVLAVSRANATVSETTLRETLATIEAQYQPLAANYAAHLHLDAQLRDPAFSASAKKFELANANPFRADWSVRVAGGLAQFEKVTPDVLSLIVCHEVGHIVAGFPFLDNGSSLTGRSAEGQADYFASQSCLRKLWRSEPARNALYRPLATGATKRLCDATWADLAEQNVCYRIVLASLHAVQVFAEVTHRPLRSGVDVDLEEGASAETLITGHPSLECRLSTLVRGALCRVQVNGLRIPGADNDEVVLNSSKSAKDAEASACAASTVGTRPACWYRAL